MPSVSRIALVLGATAEGGETALALSRHGCKYVPFRGQHGAAEGVLAIVHVANPPLIVRFGDFFGPRPGTFHFRAFWDKDGTEMIAASRRVTGKPSLPVKALP